MTDYNFLLEIRLSPQQFQILNYISKTAAGLGLNLYLVGGAVRDITLGQSAIRNLNLVTEGNAQKIFRALERETTGGSVKGRRAPSPTQAPAGSDFAQFDARLQKGVLLFANGVRVDIGATRRAIYSKPSRPPQIVPAGIFDDLRHRDFSANAMAISLHPNSRGLLLDPTNGAADIEAREFRALNSRTFLEDPSRIYRLLRLSLRLGFTIEGRTQSWLDAALAATAWEWMTPDQQAQELRALLQEENPWRVLRALTDRGIAAGLDRSLAKIRVERQQKVGPAIRSAPASESFVLAFDTLAERLPPAQRKKLAQKVMPDPKTLRLALGLESEARKLARTLETDKAAKPSSVYKLLQTKPQPLLFYTLSHYRQAQVQNPLKNFLFKYPQIREKLPRLELQALGVEPGPRFEKILNDLFMAMLDGRVRAETQIMKTLRDLAGIKDSEPAKALPHKASGQAGEQKRATPKTKVRSKQR
jgi:tRNA nucleotidyltransferase (CCA-adding enzyme)